MHTARIADLLAVSRAWARRVRQRLRESGERQPRSMGGPRVIKIDEARLAELVAQRPDATTRELRELLDVECCESSIGMALQRMGLSFKKRRSMPRSKTARMSPRSDTGGGVGSVISTHAG